MPLTPEQKRRSEDNRAAALVARKQQKKRPLDIVGLGFPSPPSPKKQETPPRILVNRSPVMTLWSAVVAERALRVSWPEALSLGAATAAVCAKKKGQALELYGNNTAQRGDDEESTEVGLLGFRVRVIGMSDDEDVRALDADGRQKNPESVEKALRGKFGEHYDVVKSELESLAQSYSAEDLNRDDGRLAYDLYAAFRPAVPGGRAGWGTPGHLDLANVRAAAAVKKKEVEES